MRIEFNALGPAMYLDDHLTRPFGSIPELVHVTAAVRPTQPALMLDGHALTYAELDELIGRVASSLQRDGLRQGQAVAACASTSFEYVALFLGVLRAGGLMTPLPPSATPQNLSAMLANSGATILFLDQACARQWSTDDQAAAGLKRVWLDNSCGGATDWSNWVATDAPPTPVFPEPHWPFNLIYSSGTTGTPKGIVQPCSMRWAHVQRAATNGYGPDTIMLASTPL
jgi:acyl-CoA synthetase (AMP-forming)/AMP-acid ligase II